MTVGFIVNGQGGLRGDRQTAAFTQVRSLDTGPRNDLPNVLVGSGCDAGWFDHWGVASLHRLRKIRSNDTIPASKSVGSDRRHSALLWSCLGAYSLLDNQRGLNDAAAMACHGILDRRSVIVCHADVLPPHRRLTIIEEADMKPQSPLPHWCHQGGRTRATPQLAG